MNPFSLIKNVYNRAANTIHNDVLQPIGRDVIAPIHSGESAAYGAIQHPIVNAWQSINPHSGVNRAKPLVQSAINQYQATPALQAILLAGHPSLQRSLGPGGTDANGIEDSSNPINQIQFTSGYGSSPSAIVHEALHRQWALNSNDHQNFIKAYNQGSFPQLRQYLSHRLGSYPDLQKGPSTQLMNLSQAPSSIQNEVHSYIPEYFQQNPNIALDGPLADYYSQFFSPSFPQHMRSK